MKHIISLLPMSLVLLGLITGLIVLVLKKGVSGVKIMLLGINVTLLGGIIVVDPNAYFGGIEYLVSFLGLVISAIGLAKRD